MFKHNIFFPFRNMTIGHGGNNEQVKGTHTGKGGAGQAQCGP